MVNPAMSRSYFQRAEILDTTPTQFFCFHSFDDWVIAFGAHLWGHEFGSAGRKGFKGKRVVNIEVEGGHNAFFKKKVIEDRVKATESIIRTSSLPVTTT